MRNTGGVTHYTLLALLAFLTFHLLPFTSNAQVGDLPLRRVPSNIQTNRTGTNNQGKYNNNTAMFPGDTADMDSLAVQGIEYHKEIPDSVLQRKVHLFRYRPTHVWIDELWYPTLDPTGVQYNDPLDALNGNYYLSKGTLGSASSPP